MSEAIAAIRGLLGQGRFLEAFDRIEERLASDALDPESQSALRVQKARALERMGAHAEARRILRGCIEDGHRSAEALGILAGLVKRRGLATADGGERTRRLAEAEELYGAAFEEHGGYWFQINLALLALLRGDRAAARRLADEVLAALEVEEARVRDEESRCWILGTRAEAQLVHGDGAEALTTYRALRARCEEQAAWELLGSVRRNAEPILEATRPAVGSDVRDALAVPPVWIAVGHRIDAPDRAVPRLPATLLEPVRKEIERRVARAGCSAAFASLAAGTDAVFQEVLAARGTKRHVLLPYDRETFVQHNELGQDPVRWRDTFDRLFDYADRTYPLARHAFGWDALCYRWANEALLGLALLEAERLGADLVGLAVYDGGAPDGPGGTAETLDLWRNEPAFRTIHEIRPQELQPAATGAAPAREPAAAQADPAEPVPTHLAGLFFADAAGFSRLNEVQTALFVERYLGVVAGVQEAYEGDMLEKNTWGDALFYAFRDLESCARFALSMREALADARAALVAAGLPEGLGLRVALHAGPVRVVQDPVTSQQRVAGTQISFAARMEPTAQVGQIVASESFAAISKARACDGYVCHYMGVKPLAKRYGDARLYRVERAIPRLVSSRHVR